MSEPLVSVVMITYGHQEFILDAINSVLQQTCDFDFELIVSNDNSPDKTHEIIQGITNSNKNLTIHYYKQEKNIGMLANFNFALLQAKGKYIALCEGDDYWIDNLKLQKQVNFLEKNPSFSICYHRVYELNVDKTLVPESMNTSTEEKTYDISDLSRGNFIHTPSLMFRNNSTLLPDWFEQSPVGDYLVTMLAAKNGEIKYLPETMGVYRKHINSTWSSLKVSESYEKWLQVLELLIDHFPEKDIKHNLIMQYKKWFHEVREIYLQEDASEKYHALVLKYIKYDFFISIWNPYYKEELKYLVSPPTGLKNAIKYLGIEFKKRFFK